MFNWIKRNRKQEARSAQDQLRPELAQEVQALREILQSRGIELPLSSGASDEQIRSIEAKLGVRLDADLRGLYHLSNGSNNKIWFAVRSDEVTPCTFASSPAGLEAWSWFQPYDEAVYRQWANANPEHDPRIQPFLHHRAWLPFAEFNGFSTAVYFDAAPASQGVNGQIIVYQHDPDAVYYIAHNFLEFFALSNKLLMDNIDDIFPEE